MNNKVKKNRRRQNECIGDISLASTVLRLMTTSLVNTFSIGGMWLGKAEVPVWVISTFKPFQMSHLSYFLSLLLMAMICKSKLTHMVMSIIEKCIKLLVYLNSQMYQPNVSRYDLTLCFACYKIYNVMALKKLIRLGCITGRSRRIH